MRLSQKIKVGSQQPHGDSQSSIRPVPGNMTPILMFSGARKINNVYVFMQAKHSYENTKINKSKNQKWNKCFWTIKRNIRNIVKTWENQVGDHNALGISNNKKTSQVQDISLLGNNIGLWCKTCLLSKAPGCRISGQTPFVGCEFASLFPQAHRYCVAIWTENKETSKMESLGHFCAFKYWSMWRAEFRSQCSF